MIGLPKNRMSGRRLRETAAAVILSTSGIFAAILVSIFSANVVPRVMHLFSLRSQGTDFQELRSKLSSAASRKWELEGRLRETRNDGRVVDARRNYYDMLLEFARRSGIKVVKFQEKTSPPIGDFPALGIDIGLLGAFGALRNFLSALESCAVPIRVQSLQISTPDAVSNDLACEMAIAVILPNDSGNKR